MSYKIINSFDETTLIDFVNTVGSLYIKDINIHLQRFSGFDNWKITDVTNALKTGAVCNEYMVSSSGAHGNLVVTNWIETRFNGNVTKLVDYLKQMEFSKNERGYFNDIKLQIESFALTFAKSEIKGINFYSPFNHSFVKPLTETPAKWNMRYVVRAILNGQYDNLKCNGILTDDYTYDAACNFRKGEIKDGVKFIKDIIESPSGWWTSIVNNHVNVCCHSFDSNSFDLNIEKKEGEVKL